MGTDSTEGQPAGTNPDPAPAAGGLEGRVDGLEQKIDKILGIIGKDEGQAHAAAEEHEETKLDRPTAIAEQVRAELDKARQAEREQAARDGEKSDLAAVKKQLAELQEKMPGQPVRKIERIWS
jgi:hypothetical protein